MAGTNPRAARIAALIQRVVASSMEAQLHDKRLANVTITEVRVTNDLQIAKIYWTQLGHEGKEDGERRRAKQSLDQARGRLRTLVGTKAGLRLTPQLQFIFDEVPGEATEIEDILLVARKRDEELAKARANAHYAGEADPYKHPDEDDDDFDDDFDDDESDDADDPDDGYGDAVEVEEFDGSEESGSAA
ncbi:MAG: 30S ribosome-binding factor RbfA [Bifidobacterium scardovii]|uniref:30S ribosome-binding factor RbfA n=1 Tax=Bifidobacterium scardovii TaxID=158787 RepID=UPI0006658087|nr:30S ribosome-binding factor RbfA [Bifidobacterium scardovii]MBS6948758.1 30S ribosome-binding factor RbfA [Bifidobacterium scardovii]MDU3737334.1 30S ribosome-binding factor RbfA [Bifidobacterium scardovii]MDU5297329.1 30S ribosome-binding factor RbfA [Bifidobacterium scardovii]MDU5611238.1 30S ribosome-binding factor RbfA [Bifidobacterium scardovii]MDU5888112.1 30S ribosome-binding factor RbfA [Bifidobacterium scardovii]